MPSKSARAVETPARSKTETFKRRAVIFDIDGTLADSFHRSNMITDWVNATDEMIEEYASLYHLDKPIAPIVELARTLHTAGFAIVLLTSRDITQYDRTATWMKNYGVPYDALYVRHSIKDRRPDPVYKADQLELIRRKYEVEFVVEDRRCVVDMWREKGVMCLQCAPGEF